MSNNPKYSKPDEDAKRVSSTSSATTSIIVGSDESAPSTSYSSRQYDNKPKSQQIKIKIDVYRSPSSRRSSRKKNKSPIADVPLQPLAAAIARAIKTGKQQPKPKSPQKQQQQSQPQSMCKNCRNVLTAQDRQSGPASMVKISSYRISQQRPSLVSNSSRRRSIRGRGRGRGRTRSSSWTQAYRNVREKQSLAL
ncbi:hypothetical protein DERP_012701 [Dermatophagoides pteronyssinus]|uniref:Uncharacterized protein n=1 Tax=Dermatophagoides pteronyssinus TaxID=6956 RepID=A0ABQ8IYK4_DERPT|nr:hypothetical protein DERP_012701 [Dermatophagoides pteronyssinus]